VSAPTEDGLPVPLPEFDGIYRRPLPARQIVLTGLSRTSLDEAEVRAAVTGPAAGAVVTFSGQVRDHDGGRSVCAIEYVGHPIADRVLAQVVTQVVTASEVEAVAVRHRLGLLHVGEVALVVAVGAAHRAPAFETVGRIVDEVKRSLPVWKRQIFTDGTHEWPGCP
jgi:molybdopterin synthase catalytic subunit